MKMLLLEIYAARQHIAITEESCNVCLVQCFPLLLHNTYTFYNLCLIKHVLENFSLDYNFFMQKQEKKTKIAFNKVFRVSLE